MIEWGEGGGSFLEGSHEAGPVMGHRLRQFPQLRRQVRRAAAAFAARRAAADRGVVLAHTRTDAARELRAAFEAAESAADDLEARSPVTSTGLGQTRVAITLARAQLLAALARHKAYEAGVVAVGASASEVARRGMEAERLARRTALEAEWAADRAAMVASRAGRLASLYGGFQLHPIFGGTGP